MTLPMGAEPRAVRLAHAPGPVVATQRRPSVRVQPCRSAAFDRSGVAPGGSGTTLPAPDLAQAMTPTPLHTDCRTARRRARAAGSAQGRRQRLPQSPTAGLDLLEEILLLRCADRAADLDGCAFAPDRSVADDIPRPRVRRRVRLAASRRGAGATAGTRAAVKIERRTEGPRRSTRSTATASISPQVDAARASASRGERRRRRTAAFGAGGEAAARRRQRHRDPLPPARQQAVRRCGLSAPGRRVSRGDEKSRRAQERGRRKRPRSALPRRGSSAPSNACASAFGDFLDPLRARIA